MRRQTRTFEVLRERGYHTLRQQAQFLAMDYSHLGRVRRGERGFGLLFRERAEARLGALDPTYTPEYLFPPSLPQEERKEAAS